jgi:Sulfotransferase family
MTDSASSHPPFFLVGSARSGTTLLRLMLNAHPQIAVPPESRFIAELHDGRPQVDVDSFLARLQVHDRFQLWDLPIEAVRREIADSKTVPFKEAVEAPYLAWMHVNGKARWGDKTPRYIEKIELLNQLWPDARFVHLVRDGRNVALSYADVPFGPKTVARAADLWARRVRAGLSAGRALPEDRYLEMRYEDFVDDAEQQVKKLTEFLQASFDPVMLDATERARGMIKKRSARYNPHIAEAPTKGMRDWQNQMPAGQVEVFEAAAGDVLTQLGYERRFTEPRAGAKARAALGKLGLPVDRLRTARKGPE